MWVSIMWRVESWSHDGFSSRLVQSSCLDFMSWRFGRIDEWLGRRRGEVMGCKFCCCARCLQRICLHGIWTLGALLFCAFQYRSRSRGDGDSCFRDSANKVSW